MGLYKGQEIKLHFHHPVDGDSLVDARATWVLGSRFGWQPASYQDHGITLGEGNTDLKGREFGLVRVEEVLS